MSIAATPAKAPSRRVSEAGGRVFASVEVRPQADAALRREWLELEAFGGAYQRLAFIETWAKAFGARLCLVAARDACGRVVALLPLHLKRAGPLTVARFAGDAWANYHMGLFRPGIVWSEADLRALLRAAGKAAGIGLYAFSKQPEAWEGVANPLRFLFGGPSPSNAFATALGADPCSWLDAHFSRATQKKLRKKARKLDAFGAVRCVRAGDPAEALRFVEAWIAQRRARECGVSAEEDRLLRALVAGGLLEMHALLAGERIAATFGAIAGGRRLSGLIVSYDAAPEIAAATPGEWLLIDVAREAAARGFATLDLGVGDSRYKREICETEEALSDTAFGVTMLGRVAGVGWLAVRAGLGAIKRRPWLLRRVQALRQALGR